jgi:REP element-mobilizing transposase RayT
MRKAKQLDMKGVNGWGGRRKGAGRPNRSGTVSHATRQRVDSRKPLHITMRVRKGCVRLRVQEIDREFKEAARRAKAFGLAILHYSILNNHIHLIVETGDNLTLAQGMRSFAGKLGKAIRRLSMGRGPVFVGRYHLRPLGTPTEVRRTMIYVLQNQARHEDSIPHVDKYSSAPYFTRWKELMGRRRGPHLRDLEPLLIDGPLPHYLSKPRSWLARTGWRRGALA